MKRERGDFTGENLLFLSVTQCNRTHDSCLMNAGSMSLKTHMSL